MIYSLLLAKGGLFDPIAKPIAAVLAFFYDLVPNYGIAIVLLTVLMMIVLTPLTIKQTRSMLVMQKLQPEMKKLQEQHKNDRQALNEAVMALYKEHNASPLGGCLPMLLPFPLFIGLLRVLEGLSHTVTTTVNGHKVTTAVPKYLTAHTKMAQDIVKAHGQLDSFGMNLAKSARNVGGGFAHTLPYFVLLLLMVGTQFYQQYQLTSRNPAAKSQPGQAAMMKFIPLFFGLISLQFPAGVVLYWTVSNIIRVGQQWALYQYDPKVKALVAKDVQEIDAKEKKAGGRGRFRDLLSNASEAANDRKNLKGKGAAKPNGTAPGAKPGTPARGGRPQGSKATGSGSGGGGNGSGSGGKSQRPSTPPGAKAGGTPKAGPPRPGIPKGATSPTQKRTPQKPGGAKPVGPPGGTTRGTTPGRANDATPQPATKPAASARPSNAAAAPTTPPAGPARPATDATPTTSTPAAGTNGTANGTTKTPAASDGNGTVAASANGGAADGGNGIDAGTASGAKGRTGGGSARTVSNRRRRKGR